MVMFECAFPAINLMVPVVGPQVHNASLSKLACLVRVHCNVRWFTVIVAYSAE